MPLRSDPSLWFNLPGVVAAYQPVRAPDSLSARYNMAHGGDSRYRAMPGALPAWSGAAGWAHNGTQYLDPGIVPFRGISAIVRFSGMSTDAERAQIGHYKSGSGRIQLSNISDAANKVAYADGGYIKITPSLAFGVLGVTAAGCYRNGIAEGVPNVAFTDTPAQTLLIGARRREDISSIDCYSIGYIQAVVICARTLSPAEVWYASRQMAYCDVNPDWSVWARKRRWFYGSQVAAAYARRIADVGRIGSRGIVE